MPLSRSRVAALAATAVLGAPASALAQSAGDDQYEDPFAGEDQSQSGGGGGGGGGGGSGQTPAPPASSTPAPTAPTAPAPTAPTDPTAATSTAQPQLPRTGTDAGAILLAGSIMLAGGIALRVRLRER